MPKNHAEAALEQALRVTTMAHPSPHAERKQQRRRDEEPQIVRLAKNHG
jgi:hypothetical protein